MSGWHLGCTPHLDLLQVPPRFPRRWQCPSGVDSLESQKPQLAALERNCGWDRLATPSSHFHPFATASPRPLQSPPAKFASAFLLPCYLASDQLLIWPATLLLSFRGCTLWPEPLISRLSSSSCRPDPDTALARFCSWRPLCLDPSFLKGLPYCLLPSIPISCILLLTEALCDNAAAASGSLGGGRGKAIPSPVTWARPSSSATCGELFSLWLF